jgi:hypothetical protein
MAQANPTVKYETERVKLRAIYVKSPPRQRLGVIRQRLSHPEIGATKLVTAISAVEALARSIVVHSTKKSDSEIDRIYSKVRNRSPEDLVQDVLSIFQECIASAYFQEDTWMLFHEAVSFRNQVVHECTYLGQDKYPSLIAAALEVLEALVTIGKLDDAPRPSPSQHRR